MTHDVVLVDADYDTGALYESYSGGYAVQRATWEEYERKAEELAALSQRLTSGEYVPGWKFRGEPKPKPTPFWVPFLHIIPLASPLRNPIPRASIGRLERPPPESA